MGIHQYIKNNTKKQFDQNESTLFRLLSQVITTKYIP